MPWSSWAALTVLQIESAQTSNFPLLPFYSSLLYHLFTYLPSIQHLFPHPHFHTTVDPPPAYIAVDHSCNYLPNYRFTHHSLFIHPTIHSLNHPSMWFECDVSPIGWPVGALVPTSINSLLPVCEFSVSRQPLPLPPCLPCLLQCRLHHYGLYSYGTVSQNKPLLP